MTLEGSASQHRQALTEALGAFRQPKMAMMLVLGFAAGLPFLLYFSVLSVWLERSDVEEALIGFFSFFGLAYSFKFLWAPVLDRFDPPGLTRIFGRRRAWIFVAQIGLALAMIGMGFTDPTTSLAATALFSFLIAFSSASQDIGIDAWRIEAARNDDEQASLAAAYQYGYKVGMVISGGVALMIADGAGFPLAYWAMAAIMALSALVFAVWDRAGGVRAAGAAGVMLLLVGAASAFGGFAGVIADASLGQWALRGLEYGFYGGALLAAGLLIAALSTALRDRPEGAEFSLAGLGTGIGFAAILFVAIAAACAAIATLVSAGAAEVGIVPSRSQIAQAAVYLAITPLLLSALAIPAIRRLPATSPRLSSPAFGPFLDFFWRHGWIALLILLFVSSYRLSDIVMGIMAKPAYSNMGYSPAEIGIVSGTYGPWIIFVGVALAGVSALSLGLRTSLVIGAVVSILGNLTFAWLVNQSPDTLVPLFVAVTADNIAGGYAGTIFVAFMSTLVNKSFAGPQYAIFSSTFSLGPKLVAGTSGVMVEAYGYTQFFIIAGALGLPAVILSLFAAAMRPDRDGAPPTPAPASADPGTAAPS
ncbi:MAG: hypothetical protein AAF253_00395 [Pseudomonadota bacterium]